MVEAAAFVAAPLGGMTLALVFFGYLVLALGAVWLARQPGTIATLIIFSEQTVGDPMRMGLFAAVVVIMIGLLLTALLVAPLIDKMI